MKKISKDNFWIKEIYQESTGQTVYQVIFFENVLPSATGFIKRPFVSRKEADQAIENILECLALRDRIDDEIGDLVSDQARFLDLRTELLNDLDESDSQIKRCDTRLAEIGIILNTLVKIKQRTQKNDRSLPF